MRIKMSIGCGALALSAACTPVPAFAQAGIPGYAPNGSVVAVRPYHHRLPSNAWRTHTLYNYAPQYQVWNTPAFLAPGWERNYGEGVW
jgi:hypothetical protein